MRSLALVSACLLSFGCGGDEADTPRDTASDTGADTSPDTAEVSDTALADTGPDTADTASDTSADAADGELAAWFAGCDSLFAVRIAEQMRGATPSFPLSCDAPLVSDIGRLKPGGAPLCRTGESPNACRQRLYATPPAMASLEPACAEGGAADGCMLGSFLPRCADGGDGCAEDEVVCWDGMRPMIYAEAATEGASDVWWFHMGGEGGPCSGGTCWATYRFGTPEFKNAMSSLHPDSPARAASSQGGVMSGRVAPYARINRVRFERCTDAISDAIEEVDVADGVPAEFADAFPGVPIASAMGRSTVYHKGFNTWRATFRAMTTLSGRDRDGDGTADMPSLADARLVILSGSSDASMWVSMAADRLTAELEAIAGDDVEVRLAIDGMFPPMLDNEARYHPEVPADFDMLSMPYGETGLCRLEDNGDAVDNESCSDANFTDGGTLHGSYLKRGVLLDASCEAAHGVGAPECFDRNHTLLHHIAVPVLVLADQEDNTVSDNAPSHADDRSWFFATPDVYRERIVDQGWDIVDHWGTAAREEGAGPAGGFVLILPKARRDGEGWGQATHVRFGDDDRMNDTMTLCDSDGDKLATATFNAMIGAWIEGSLPRTFAIEDAERASPDGSYWVTGSTCRTPE